MCAERTPTRWGWNKKNSPEGEFFLFNSLSCGAGKCARSRRLWAFCAAVHYPAVLEKNNNNYTRSWILLQLTIPPTISFHDRTESLGMKEKCFVLWVTSTRSCSIAVAAISASGIASPWERWNAFIKSNMHSPIAGVNGNIVMRANIFSTTRWSCLFCTPCISSAPVMTEQ